MKIYPFIPLYTYTSKPNHARLMTLLWGSLWQKADQKSASFGACVRLDEQNWQYVDILGMLYVNSRCGVFTDPNQVGPGAHFLMFIFSTSAAIVRRCRTGSQRKRYG